MPAVFTRWVVVQQQNLTQNLEFGMVRCAFSTAMFVSARLSKLAAPAASELWGILVDSGLPATAADTQELRALQ